MRKVLWKHFQRFAENLDKLGIETISGVLYAGLMSDDALAEFKRMMGIVGISPCCTSEFSSGEVWRGDIGNEIIYVLIITQNTKRVGIYNVQIRYIRIKLPQREK